jgi:osmotically-inducible protein OsmY
MEKLKFEPILDASNITLSIQGNHDIVVLAGTVKSYAEKLIAENAVKTLRGVKTVVNEIEVDPYIRFKRTDIEIASDTTNALKTSVLVPDDRIKLIVKNGIVTLTGEVEWQYQKDSAEIAIRNLWGIKSIINNITVKPSVRINENEVKQEIKKEFERHARIDADKIKIQVEGRKVILKGEVSSFDEIDIAEGAAWSIPGVAEVKNELEIE